MPEEDTAFVMDVVGGCPGDVLGELFLFVSDRIDAFRSMSVSERRSAIDNEARSIRAREKLEPWLAMDAAKQKARNAPVRGHRPYVVRHTPDADDMRQALSMHELGATIRQISVAIKSSRHAVRAMLAAHGLEGRVNRPNTDGRRDGPTPPVSWPHR